MSVNKFRRQVHAPLALLICLSACTKTTLPEVDEGTAGDAGAAEDSSVDGATVDGSDEPTDPRDEPREGRKHPACQQAFPDVAPPLPEVNETDTGRPKFDLWRDLECETVTGKTCGTSNCNCLYGDESKSDGVCVSFDIDVWCDGEGEVISYNDNECWICASAQAHAKACCDELPGFDCRAWPYPADGPPGSACATHEDCEQGLVCSAPDKGEGYGICACPGVSPGWGNACGGLID